MPVRAALTGNLHGPELVNILYVLGKQNILKRIKSVLIKIAHNLIRINILKDIGQIKWENMIV